MFRFALLFLFSAQQLFPQQLFTNRCAACHGEDARGTAKGPGLAMNPRVAEQSAEQLRAYLERGNSGAGMPSFADVPAIELASLVRYLRRINADTILVPVAAPGSSREIAWGPPQPGDWLTYNGNDSGNRYSPLDQIRTSNVSLLKLKWVFPIPYFGLETTPLAAAGVLFVTGPNQVFALDAVTGSAATGAQQRHRHRYQGYRRSADDVHTFTPFGLHSGVYVRRRQRATRSAEAMLNAVVCSRIRELQEALSAATIALEISSRNSRVAALQKRWDRLRAGLDLILDQRGADMADLPGGASGILARDSKGKEATAEVYRIDPGVVSLVADSAPTSVRPPKNWSRGRRTTRSAR